MFPRARAVGVRKYVSEDMRTATIATRLSTRKCADIKKNPNVTIYWQEHYQVP